VRRVFLLAAALFIAIMPTRATAQGREITGKVTAVDGGPIAEAIVSIVGQPLGVRSNAAGEYRIRVPGAEATLLVRAIGYKRQSVRVTGATQDFTLEKDVLQLEGVTVTGQATTVDKRNASTAIASVSAEELMKAPAKSLEGNLAGKITGAQIFENSGTPGGGMQIQIRGATSILGQGDPLYVVDGVMVSNQSISGGLAAISRSSGSTSSNQDQTTNRLADLNPNDIESIEVLKSAAASAIYGSRATNGVVVITTKKGKAGSTRFNVTQRVGTQRATRLVSSRKFNSYDEVKPWLGASPIADSIARANCTTSGCKWYDWQGMLYGTKDPSYETLLSASGGSAATRFFASVNDKQSKGIQYNTGARRTSARLNIDQTIGEKFTASAGLDVTHSFAQNGIGNNDNSGTSPIYAFGYEPAIYDISQRTAPGRFITMYMKGGGTASSNPFDLLENMTNNEDTWRQTGNLQLRYAAFSNAQHSLSLSFIGGVDRFQFEGNQYTPGFLQFEPADGFLGTSQIGTTTSRFINQSVNAVHTWTPGWKFFNSAQTSVGGTYETQYIQNYNIRSRGILPGRRLATGGTDVAVGNGITEFRDQSVYVNEQLILLDEKVSLSASVRADRGTANGDREAFYNYPKVSGSYRWVNPLRQLTDRVDEIKFRAAWGQSGNRPNYGSRDITVGSGGIIGGLGSLVAATTLGNPAIKPEVMNEFEYGIDGSAWNQRIGFELTNYNRTIKDLLVNFPLAASSGLNTQQINGGQMSTKGFEMGITIVPISRRDLEWSFKTTYQKNQQTLDALAVPSFAVGGFGVAYGRNRFAIGELTTYIWGNQRFSCLNTTVNGVFTQNTSAADGGKPCRKIGPLETIAGSVTRDSIIADAAPRHTTQFLNSVTYKRFSVTALLDWRNGGATSTMTKNLFDEGGQSRDYADPSPDPNQKLGQYRFSTHGKGDISTYIDDGTYLKFRELTVSYDAPRSWANLAKAREMRISFQGRNLAMWSDYWGSDPEFNNFGNTNFSRFVDLGPYPPSKQFFLSIDLNY
jgi:TonB-linked SusC/RagA family outer membrane protein